MIHRGSFLQKSSIILWCLLLLFIACTSKIRKVSKIADRQTETRDTVKYPDLNDPSFDVEFYQEKGEQLYNEGKYMEATIYFETIIKYENGEDLPNSINDYGYNESKLETLYGITGQQKKLLKMVERKCLLDSTESNLEQLGLFYVDEGLYEESLKLFFKAYEITRPDYRWHYQNLVFDQISELPPQLVSEILKNCPHKEISYLRTLPLVSKIPNHAIQKDSIMKLIRQDIIESYVLNTPDSCTKSIVRLANYLIVPAQNDFEKVRAIFRWITENISYSITS